MSKKKKKKNHILMVTEFFKEYGLKSEISISEPFFKQEILKARLLQNHILL